MNKFFNISIILVIIISIIYFGYFKNKSIEKYLNKEYTPKYKINDLYNSKELNYRTILDDKEKTIYEEYIQKIINFETKFSIDMSIFSYEEEYMLFEKFKKINQTVIMDHPEIIYFGYPSMSTRDNKTINITISYALNKDEYNNALNEIKNKINKIKKDTKNLNEYEKVKYVYEYLGYKNNYGEKTNSISQSAYSAFNDKLSPVCAGYSRASEIIFQNIGITSLLISGKLKSNWFSGDNHEWNIVKIDNKYYNYDVTQSSIAKSTTNKISYYGLLNNNKKYLSPSNKTLNINGNKYDYYKYNNLEYSYKNNNLNILKNILNNTNDKYVELRINNIDNFKLDFNKIKNELNLKTYITIDNIIILEKL